MKRADVLWALIMTAFIVSLSMIVKAQDSAYVYIVRDSAQLITTNKIIISSEFVNILLEPIPGKVTRWEITRKEEAPPVIEPVVTIVNNTELTYTGLWEHATGATYSVSHSGTIGATAKYTFTGNRIEVISDMAPGHGVLGFTIDGKPEESVNLYSATRLNGTVVIDRALVSGSHTITFRVVSATVLLDYLRITK